MGMEEKIKDRLENGFRNWNGGYDCWLNWCKTLYEPDAHYNVQGPNGMFRMTLKEYEDKMKYILGMFDIQLGEFKNMIIKDDWAAIRYIVKVTSRKTGKTVTQHTMEFVHFKDNPDPIGVRVIEGWALSDLPVTDK